MPARRHVARVTRAPANSTALVFGRRRFAQLQWSQLYTNQAFTNSDIVKQYVWWPMSASPMRETTPIAGDPVYMGLQQFAGFYGLARLHAAKIVVRITSEGLGAVTPSLAQDSSMRAVLVALPEHVDDVSPLTNAPSALALLSYQVFRSGSGVRSGVIAPTSAGRNTLTLSTFGMTKRMFDKKDITDDPSGYNRIAIDTSLVAPGVWTAPINNWAFILQIYLDELTALGVDTFNFTVDVRITGYWELYNREFVVDSTLVPPS